MVTYIHPSLGWGYITQPWMYGFTAQQTCLLITYFTKMHHRLITPILVFLDFRRIQAQKPHVSSLEYAELIENFCGFKELKGDVTKKHVIA